MASDAQEIASSLRVLLPSSIRVGARTVRIDDRDLLHAEERRLVARAVPSRIDEFASGRALLHELTGTDTPILRRANRAPDMPNGWVGSLAHDHGLVVAAVGATADVSSLGLDIESTAATFLEEEIAAVVLRADDGTDDVLLGHVVKESVYKAWSTLNDGILDYHDVRISIVGRRFTAVVEPTGDEFDVAVASAAGRWIAVVVA